MQRVSELERRLNEAVNPGLTLRYGQGEMSVVSLVAKKDQVKNNTDTLADDDELSIALEPYERFAFLGTLFIESTLAADFRVSFSIPTDAALGWSIDAQPATAVSDATGVGAYNGLIIPSSFSVSLTTTKAGIAFRGAVSNGGHYGRLILQWCQDTATLVDTTRRAGSNLIALKATNR